MPAPRNCPVCGQLHRTPLHTQRFARIGDRTILNGYAVVSCDHCGMVFADGIPSQDALDGYYAAGAQYARTATPSDVARLQETAGDIAARVARGSVLDVGCATGELLHALQAYRYGDLTGADPSEAAVRACVERGFFAVTGTIRELPAIVGQYDLVTAIGVIEHLHDVERALAILRNRLKPGGQLYLEVPDVERFADADNVAYQELSAEHVNFYSRQSLATQLARVGMTVEYCWQVDRCQGPSVMAPTLCVIACVGQGDPLAVDRISAPAMDAYLRVSAIGDAALRQRVQLACNGMATIVWGTGTLTRRLAAAGAFDGSDVVAFTDSDTRYVGELLAGKQILDPGVAIADGAQILPLSRQHFAAIRAQIPDARACPLTVV